MLKIVFADDFCMTPEPVRPVLSDSIIRMMPDEVRTAVYLFVAPPPKFSVSVPKLLLLLLPELGLYEPEMMANCCGPLADSTSSTPAVIVSFAARVRLPAAATA